MSIFGNSSDKNNKEHKTKTHTMNLHYYAMSFIQITIDLFEQKQQVLEIMLTNIHNRTEMLNSRKKKICTTFAYCLPNEELRKLLTQQANLFLNSD